MGKIMEKILSMKPNFFGEIRGKNFPTGQWFPLDRLADLGTTASVKSIISGPESTVRSQAKPFFDKKLVEIFMTKFRPQGDIGIMGRIRKRTKPKPKPKTIKRPGVSSQISVSW